ncbi:MAG: hypothetical protein KKB37_15260 [Alphaproteobacteria bacterium]|nr:hypothetical protein [Alphaproteobacteria bacterium]
MASIAISVCLLVISSSFGADSPTGVSAHLVIAALICTAMSLLAIGESRKLINSGASQMMVAGTLTRFMGLIWAWAALALSITYGTGILEWSSWLQHFLGAVVLSGLCLFLSRILHEGADAGAEDPGLLRMSRYIAAVTLFMAVVAVGLFGVMRLQDMPIVEQGVWAANNVFLFGAIALAAVSSYLLKASINEAH